jgi:hypothetical protein
MKPDMMTFKVKQKCYYENRVICLLKMFSDEYFRSLFVTLSYSLLCILIIQ